MLFAIAAVLSFVFAFAALALVGARLADAPGQRIADNFTRGGNLLATAEARRFGGNGFQLR